MALLLKSCQCTCDQGTKQELKIKLGVCGKQVFGKSSFIRVFNKAGFFRDVFSTYCLPLPLPHIVIVVLLLLLTIIVIIIINGRDYYYTMFFVESNLSMAPCQRDAWTCFNRRCITKNLLCNGQDDCGDGSDETYAHARCRGRPLFAKPICSLITWKVASSR